MPGNPQPSDLHVNHMLTDLSIAFWQEHDDFKAHEIFPEVRSDKQSNSYAIFDKGEWFRDEAERRKYGTPVALTSYEVSTATFKCEVWAIGKDYDEEDFQNADDVFELETEGTEIVTQRLLLREENRWAAAFFAATVWTTDLNGGGVDFVSWDDAGGLPITDMLAQRLVMKQLTGKWPQVAAFGANVLNAVRLNVQVRAQLTPTQKEVATKEVLAMLFDIEEVMELSATQNTANEGVAAVMAFIQGDSALLVHRADSPGRRKPSGGYTFVWSGLSGGGPNSQRIKSYPITEKGIELRVEGNIATDLQLVSADLGIFFIDPLA